MEELASYLLVMVLSRGVFPGSHQITISTHDSMVECSERAKETREILNDWRYNSDRARGYTRLACTPPDISKMKRSRRYKEEIKKRESGIRWF